MITCPNCGTQNEAGSSFCFQCGADIRNVPSKTAPPAAPTPPPFGSAPSQPTQPTFGAAPPPPGFPPSAGQQSGFPPSAGQQSGFPPAQPPTTPTPPPGFPAQYPQQQYQQPGFPPGYDPARQGWTPEYMAPPEPKKRRRWLWITIGLILGCILVCIVASVLLEGSDAWTDFQTQIAEYQTEEAN